MFQSKFNSSKFTLTYQIKSKDQLMGFLMIKKLDDRLLIVGYEYKYTLFLSYLLVSFKKEENVLKK